MSNAMTVRGVNAFTEQPLRRRYRIENGWETVRTWKGPNTSSLINAKEDELVTLGAQQIETTRGKPTIIEASFPDDPGPTRSELIQMEADAEWELIPTDLSRRLGSHGVFNKSLGESPVAILRIDGDIEQGIAGGVDYEAIYTTAGEMNGYRDLKIAGTEEYLAWSFVLRKTMSSSKRSTYKIDFQNNGKTDGWVVPWDAIQIPSSVKFIQPYVHMYNSGAMGIPGAAVKSGTTPGWCDIYINEWLQKPAGLISARGGGMRKYHIVREWLGAIQWNGLIYHGGTGIPTT